MLYDPKTDSYIPCAISVASTIGFTFGIFLFRVEGGSNFAQDDDVNSSGDFSKLKTKLSNVEFAPKGDLRPLI